MARKSSQITLDHEKEFQSRAGGAMLSEAFKDPGVREARRRDTSLAMKGGNDGRGREVSTVR